MREKSEMGSQPNRKRGWIIAVLSIGAQVVLAAVALAAPAVRRIPPPPSPPRGEWPQCATEGGKCYVPSGTLVRYGVGASWVYGTASGAFDCNNATFGDPAQGTRKGCYFNTPSLPGDWTRCAIEGGRCNLVDSQVVRYGVDGAWLYNTAGSTVACTNATFSDPKPGTRKECYVGTPVPAGGWLRCAVEGGKCNFVGKGTMRYGAGDAWVYGTSNGTLACTNGAFSDPKPGVRKECFLSAPEPRDWTRCAIEGGRCNLTDSQVVRYGAEGAWVHGIAASTVACTNATFGDPKPGSRKECFLGIPAPQGNWLRCAVEGGKCNFVGKATVRYGSGDAWVYGSAADGIACTNAAFSDAKPGFQKECYFIGPAPTGNWLRCAVEGGRCNFTGRATVRYGAGDAWVYGTASGGIACTNAAFSDPKPGTQKECYFVP